MSKLNYLKPASFFVSAVVFLASCDDSNPNYCPGADPLDDCRANNIDAAPPITKCSDDAGCASDPSGNRVCDVMAMACVQCTKANDSACSGMTPVCSADNACRGCTADADCASDVCLPDGACAAEADVAYAAEGGSGMECSKSMPCASVSVALTKNKPTVRVKGTVKEGATVVMTAATKRIIGAMSGGVMESSNAAGDALISVPTGTDTTFEGLTVGGTTTIKPVACVEFSSNSTGKFTMSNGKVGSCQTGIIVASSGGSVSLTGSTVSGNGGIGISASGGSVSLTGSTVSGNGGIGISASGGSVSLTGSTVSGNQGGGLLLLSNARFTVVKNFIIDNGNSSNSGSSLGGVSLDAADGAMCKFEDNTVADNHRKNTIAPAGVLCSVTGFVAPRNLITGNDSRNGNMVGFEEQANTTGDCTYPNSFTEAAAAPGTMFVDPSQNNYHLAATAPATVRDVPALTTCSSTDFDGDARPQGASCDIGADEYKP